MAQRESRRRIVKIYRRADEKAARACRAGKYLGESSKEKQAEEERRHHFQQVLEQGANQSSIKR